MNLEVVSINSRIKKSGYKPVNAGIRVFAFTLAMSSILLSCVLTAVLPCAAAEQKKQIVIKLWEYPRWSYGPQQDKFGWVLEKIAEFEKLHPGVKVELTKLSWDGGVQKKQIAIAANDYPDVTAEPLANMIKAIDNSVVEPLDEYLTPDDLKDYFPGAIEAFTHKKAGDEKFRVWGFPWLSSGSVLFVNKRICAKRGVVLPSDGKWTYDEFVDILKKLTYDSNGDGQTDVYGFGYTIEKFTPNVWPVFLCDGAAILNKEMSKYTLNSPEGVSGVKKLLELDTKYHAVVPRSAALSSGDMWQMFAREEKVAVAPWGMWAVQALRNPKKSAGFDFEIMHYPTIAGGKNITFVGCTGFLVLKQKDPEKKKMCVELCQYLTNTENQKAVYVYSSFPTRKSTGNLYTADTAMSRGAEVVANGIITPPHRDWLEIDDKIFRQLQLILLGKVGIEEGLSAPERDIDATLAVAASVKKGVPIPVWFNVLVALLLVSAGAYLVYYIIKSWADIKRNSFAYLLILPALSVFFIFLFYPLLQAIFLVFLDYRLAGETYWAGLKNFEFGVFKSSVFWISMKNTLVYSIVRVPFTVLISLVVATLIYPLADRAQTVFRAAFYLPGVISLVVMAMVWRWLYNPNYGLLNQLFIKLGIIDSQNLVPWLTDTQTAMVSLMLMAVCTVHGAGVIIYLAAMNNIPVSLYELAGMEGATGLQKWTKITIPLLKSTTLYLLVMNTIASFQVFTQVYVMTKGGPGYSTFMAIPLIYFSAFDDWEFGIAAAQALVVFVCIVVMSLVQFKWLEGKTEYV
ncbi:MAG: extracellular solute-binding protein [Elusimicrobiota bacterium]